MTVIALTAYLKSDEQIHKKVLLRNEHTCIDLHHVLMKAFHLSRIKSFEFYSAGKDWDLLEKYILNHTDNSTEGILMRTVNMKDLFKKPDAKLIYECSTLHHHFIFYLEILNLKEKINPNYSYPHWIDTSGRTLNESREVINESFFEGEYDYVDPKKEFGEEFEELDLDEEEFQNEEEVEFDKDTEEEFEDLIN